MVSVVLLNLGYLSSAGAGDTGADVSPRISGNSYHISEQIASFVLDHSDQGFRFIVRDDIFEATEPIMGHETQADFGDVSVFQIGSY